MFAETSQLNEVMANEGAWRRLNPALHCGQTKMKFKAMGPGSADLQLDIGIVNKCTLFCIREFVKAVNTWHGILALLSLIGNEHPLPLTQLPESCGHSLQQNTLGLVLVAPYDGCNVIQEVQLYPYWINQLKMYIVATGLTTSEGILVVLLNKCSFILRVLDFSKI